MNLEVGKFYKTRNGLKARIYAIDCGGDFPIHGAVFVGDGWASETWRADGVFLDQKDGSMGIVSEWREPHAVNGWVNIYKTEMGLQRIYSTKQLAGIHAAKNCIGCVYVSGEEGAEP